MGDWRDTLLRRFSFPAYERLGRNPIGWPDYAPGEVVRYAIGDIGEHHVVAAVWDFTQYGGSFGELDATAFVDAVDRAIQYSEPLVSFVRSGGVRLQEGMAALVGMPRAQLALQRLAQAGVPHLAVADHPTTGGVFVSVVSRADLRVGVRGATVGFAGPRVVEALTGAAPGPDSHTAESAYAAGLLDAVVPEDRIGGWLTGALDAMHDGPAEGGSVVELRAPGHDDAVSAWLTRTRGRSMVLVQLSHEPGRRPGVGGYRLVVRAARLADRLRRPLVLHVDTPSADPGPAAESEGIASAIADAMDAVLACRAPTLAVVTGEGGSGGALAASVADRVLMYPTAYFAALGAAGAGAALRISPDEAADRMAVRPAQLVEMGFADSIVAPDDLGPAVADQLAELGALDEEERLGVRRARWSAPLPGQLT